MGELKMEGQPMEFSNDELKNRAEEQAKDPVYQKERKDFQDAKTVNAAETPEKQFGISSQLERNFEALKLAQKFGLKAEAKQQVDYMQQFFEDAPGIVEKNQEVLKNIFERVAGGNGYISSRKDWKTGDFDIFKNFCESDLGEVIELTEEESKKLNMAPSKSSQPLTLLRVEGTNCVFIWYPGLTLNEDVFSARIWDKESLAKLEEIPAGKFSS